MGLVKEFREFALRGNVLDLAVGVIIGGAFGKIINSMINDVLMPFIGIVGKADFNNLYIGLTQKVSDGIAAAGGKLPIEEAKKLGPVFAYGTFITEVINFVVLAACVFAIVKLFNTARKRFEAEKPAPAPAGPTPDQKLLTEIRDLLASRK
jgi:large conductance mechanosensitive channel